MGTLLQGGIVVEFEPASVERVDLRVAEGRVVARGEGLVPAPDDEVVQLGGKLVLPGLVSAHTRLAASLARGMPGPSPAPEGYLAHLEQVRWPYEDALDLDAVGAAVQVGALEALACGTTTAFDLHSSPRCVDGSLTRVARALHETGLRGVLSYAVSDRAGEDPREAALDETLAFAGRARGRFRAQVGLAPLFTVSDAGLDGVAHAVGIAKVGAHVALAEDPVDERQSVERHGASPVARLVARGLLTPATVAAHVGHLAWEELSQVITTGAWLVHTPRAAQELELGYAPALKFGARASLGTDGGGADVLAELQAAWLRSREAGAPIDPLRYLANGHRLAAQAFDLPVGPLRKGAVADLLVVDYQPSVPLTAETLGWHLVLGLSSRHVEAVMVDGAWRVWARRPLSVSPDVVAEHAREAAAALWARVRGG